MKRPSHILLLAIVAVISLAQYRLIGSSLASFAAWCVLEASHQAPFGTYWNPALFEHWLAGIAWVIGVLWLVRSSLVPLRARKGWGLPVPAAPPMSSRIRGASSRFIGLVGYIALVSPILTPVNPNVQGNLVTTRLLPPLSAGYVREYLDPTTSDTESAGHTYRVYTAANHYLLHRTTILSAGIHADSSAAGGRTGAVIREFPLVFPFGTDDNARDVFSRVVAGTRVSLGIGLTAALGALFIGAAVGFAAGMSRSFLDGILMRLTDLFLAIPGLLLVIGVLAFVGQSIVMIVVVLSFSGWMSIARVVRGEVLSLREREFILAAQLLRVSSWKIVTRHLLPNLRPVLLTATVLQFANAVLGEASLGFLGLGIQPPTATWGSMMGEAMGYLSSAWWVGVFPGLLLAAVLVSAHSLGENLASTADAAATEQTAS
jgi:peptide/nickel transport system permease protein